MAGLQRLRPGGTPNGLPRAPSSQGRPACEWYETELTDRARAHVPGLYERVLGRIPAGRWGKPQDIVGTALWLCSGASDYVTGIAVPVDGGYSASLF